MPSSTATQVLAPGVTAASSSTITVAQGEVVHLVAFVGVGVTDNKDWPPIRIEHLTPGENRPVSERDAAGNPNALELAPNRTNLALTSPGEYVANRPAYSGTPIGVAEDR